MSETLELKTMNIELTTKCPLRCPQCYCTLEGGKDIDLDTAAYWIEQGSKNGVEHIMLSGGETMCYPHIYELVSIASKHVKSVNVALSGYGLNQQSFEKLIEAGVTEFFISLNGSTNEINSHTRDGYELAIAALELLKRNGYKNTTINWVMHSSNADDFENVVKLAEQYEVARVVVMGVKPDSKHALKTIPTAEQMIAVKKIMLSYKGPLKIFVESCFSPMLALVCDTKLFGNMNVGTNKGCGAGRTAFSVNVDGLLSPCRHLEYYEKYSTLEEYYEKSNIIKTIQNAEDNRREPCVSCKYMNYCRHCLAINSKINGEIYIGNEYCPVRCC